MQSRFFGSYGFSQRTLGCIPCANTLAWWLAKSINTTLPSLEPLAYASATILVPSGDGTGKKSENRLSTATAARPVPSTLTRKTPDLCLCSRSDEKTILFPSENHAASKTSELSSITFVTAVPSAFAIQIESLAPRRSAGRQKTSCFPSGDQRAPYPVLICVTLSPFLPITKIEGFLLP